MTQPLIRNAYYPRNTSLHESLALKVITRVVSDGISLRNAVREAIKIAELNKKDIFLLLSVLQDFGQVTNGDYKNYWTTGWGEGVGQQALDASQGTNYFASNNQKVVTAETKQMFELFEQVEKMRAFASDEEIVEINPELSEVIATMQKTQKIAIAMLDDEEYRPMHNPGEELDSDLDLKDPEFSDEDDQDELQTLEKLFQRPASLNSALLAFAAGGAVNPNELTVLQKLLPMVKKRLESGSKKPIIDIIHELAPQFPSINLDLLVPKLENFFKTKFPDLLTHVEPKQNVTDSLQHKYQPEGVDVKGLGELEQRQRQRQQRQLQLTPASFSGRITVAVEEGGLEGLPVEAQTAPAGDLNIEEPAMDAPADELTVEEGAEDNLNVTISPLPSELMEQAQGGPKWEISNLLSINKAEKYYTELKKQLEDVAINNPNISMDLESDAKYDKVRNMIDAELEKIGQAIKGKEKIEKKEDKLEQEITAEEPELTVEESASGAEPTVKALEEPSGIEEAEPTTEGM